MGDIIAEQGHYKLENEAPNYCINVPTQFCI